MSSFQPTDESRVVWSLGHWRCELHRSDRLRLYRGDTLVAEHVAKAPDHLRSYAEIWQTAIRDTFAQAESVPDPQESYGTEVAHVWTDGDGRIWQLNEPATRLLNIAHPNRRLITVFFVTERDRLAKLLSEATRSHVGYVDRVILRPRERRQIPVRVRLEREGESVFVRWTLMPHVD